MSPSTPSETPKYVLFKENVFKGPIDATHGPSPYAEKLYEFPSYKRSTGRLEVSGALDAEYQYSELTPQIGREYSKAQLKDILNNETQLRDLAITISQRGVVFFRNQELSVEQQKVLAQELSRLAGKPESSGLHIHHVAPAGGFIKEDGSEEIDPEVSLISSQLNKDLYSKARWAFRKASAGWH